LNGTGQDEITAYVEGVRAALAGLPEATRDELLEDLPEHLAEVRAEGNGTLTERLGATAAYAAELRSTAGFVGGFPDPPPGRFVRLRESRDKGLRLLNRADMRVGPVIGYAKASDFLILLRPAWWALRGYLAAMAIAYLLASNRGGQGLLPRVGGSLVVALVLLAGCVILSILLGRRGARLAAWPRYALWSGTALLALFAFAGFVSADRDARSSGYSDVSSYEVNPYGSVRDVFVYDSQGRLVTGARLFDQDGSPIHLGDSYPVSCTDPGTGEATPSRSLGYPFCPQNAPFDTGRAGSFPSASPSRSVAADPGSSATPASPSVSPSVSASVSRSAVAGK